MGVFFKQENKKRAFTLFLSSSVLWRIRIKVTKWYYFDHEKFYLKDKLGFGSDDTSSFP